MPEQFHQYEFKWFKDDFDTNPETRGRLFQNRSWMEESRASWEPPLPGVFLGGEIFPNFLPNQRMPPRADVLAKWPGFAAAGDCPLELMKLGSLGGPDVTSSTHTTNACSTDVTNACSTDVTSSIGVIVTGQWVPASGTHNVLVGIVRHMHAVGVRVLGFLGGPQGFARRHFVELTLASVEKYLNQGGSDCLGFGSLRAMEKADYEEIRQLGEEYGVSALIFVGGPNELAHASQLVCLGNACSTDIPNACSTDVGAALRIISIFQSPNANVFLPHWLPVTLGFDSTRAALSEYTGNIAMDSLSSGRFFDVNFVRAGSSTIALEIALAVRPALTILAEELSLKQISLQAVVADIVDLLETRFSANLRSATILVSEKFYAFLPGFAELQTECRQLYAAATSNAETHLSAESAALFGCFSLADQRRIARAYDADGNPTWPETDPEKFLARLVQQALRARADVSAARMGFSEVSIRTHSLGLEGRCPPPTAFDCSLGLALGYTAAVLALNEKCSGYVATVSNLAKPVADWVCGGIPLASLLSVATPSTLLTKQFGGANQELINLARQRAEREATVPEIQLRPANLLEDPLFLEYSKVRTEDRLAQFTRQPGPHQVGSDVSPVGIRLSAGCTRSFRLAHVESIGQMQHGRPAQTVCTHRWRSKLETELHPAQWHRLKYVPPKTTTTQKKIWTPCITTPRRASRLDLLKLVFPFTHATSAMTQIDYPQSSGNLRIGPNNVLGEMSPPPSPPLLIPPTPRIVSAARMSEVRTGIVFLGRQAPGCHNVVWGLQEAVGPVVGIFQGAHGLINCVSTCVTEEVISRYRNQSGIDMLGRTETPLKTRAELASCVDTCRKLGLEGLVVVGGIGTHADTALLAELMLASSDVKTCVIGVPASVENDIPFVEQTLGHDTACKVYASIVGSLATLAASSKRQWCFVRISGRSLSHLVAEVALQTHPNLVLLSKKFSSLSQIVALVCDLITERAKAGFDFGILVFPESILGDLEEVRRLVAEVRSGDGDLGQTNACSADVAAKKLSPTSAALFETLHERGKQHLVSEGKIVDPEILLESLVGRELQRRKIFAPTPGAFVSSTHALSSQGRSSLPSNFDCDLGFALGLAAGSLVREGKTGLLATMTNLAAETSEWVASAVPLVSLLSISRSISTCWIEIQQTSVPSFHQDHLPPPSMRRFVNPGPLQFSGPQADSRLLSLRKVAAPGRSVAELCVRLLTLAATATDESVRQVIQTGLTNALSLHAVAHLGGNVCSADVARPTSAPSGTLRRHGSHCRVVELHVDH